MEQQYDLLGVGAGIFNLSLAALLSDNKSVTSHFLDKNTDLEWYPGLMLDNAKMQTCCIKDLVSLADPTNQYSFLNYLSSKNRLFQFLNRSSFIISRKEFFDYAQWVSSRLSNISRGISVEKIYYKNGLFEVTTDKQSYYAKNLSISIGRNRFLPESAKVLEGDKVFHGLDYLFKKSKISNAKRIVIVGGGQTASEILLDIMDSFPRVEEITWISRRNNFLPLDDSPFVNDYYIPSYVDYFSSLDNGLKRVKHKEQRLTSDGISLDTLTELYEKIYENNFIRKDSNLNVILKPFRKFSEIQKVSGGYNVIYQNMETHESVLTEADAVVFATGFENKFPSMLSEISDLLHLDDNEQPLKVGSNFEVSWEYGHLNTIYVQNMSRFSHGPWESNISLAAWRSAKIVNHLTQGNSYPMLNVNDSPFVSWRDSDRNDYRGLTNDQPSYVETMSA